MKILGGILLCLAASAAFADVINPPQLSTANNGFAFDLLRQIEKEQPGRNIFISPHSVSTVLQILGDGAADKTKTEIQGVLKTDDFPADELNGAWKELNQSLMSQSAVTLDLANSIWFNKGIELKPDFVST